MKRSDWKCPECGWMRIRIQLNSCYSVCPNGHGKLHKLWKIDDLPAAKRFDYKRFTIAGEPGFWKYVPHEHTGCLLRAPKTGTIVASFNRKAWTFERTKPWAAAMGQRELVIRASP